MEKIISKIEEKFDSQIQNFEKSPLKTGLKWLLILYVLKYIYKTLTSNE